MTKRDRSNKTPFKRDLGAAKNENADTMPPIFSFEKMGGRTGHSISCCNNEERAALSTKLFELSRLSWQEIKDSPRHGAGTEKISRASFLIPLPPALTEDIVFLSLRYNGKKAMIGYRDGRILHVLFLDHNFKVYRHG